MTSKDFDEKRLQDLKDNIVQEQELLKKYEDLLREERDPPTKEKYSRGIENSKESLAKYKREYAELEQHLNLRIAINSDNKSSSSQRNQLSLQDRQSLFKLLLEIDFKEQMNLVEEVASKYQTLGFLVHGAPEHGQEILISQIHRNNKSWKKNNPININVSQKGVGRNIDNLRAKVARSLHLSPKSNQHEILRCICERLITQDVIFIFSSVDYMQIDILVLWLDEFWRPLVRMAESIRLHQKKNTHLLMFLVDYCGSISQSDITFAEKYDPLSYDPCIPVCLPCTNRFSEKMLKEWIKFAIRFSSDSPIVEKLENLSADYLYEESQRGIPEYVFETICNELNTFWEGELAKWLI